VAIQFPNWDAATGVDQEIGYSGSRSLKQAIEVNASRASIAFPNLQQKQGKGSGKETVLIPIGMGIKIPRECRV
jgi:hypothetical protein